MSSREHHCPKCGQDWHCSGCHTKDEERLCDDCVSMGCKVDPSLCSVCGDNTRKCEHLIGDDSKAVSLETETVLTPADPCGRAEKEKKMTDAELIAASSLVMIACVEAMGENQMRAHRNEYPAYGEGHGLGMPWRAEIEEELERRKKLLSDYIKIIADPDMPENQVDLVHPQTGNTVGSIVNVGENK